METLCLVEKKKQKVLTVPASMQARCGGTWNWLFVISFDVLTGKSVCGFRSGWGWSGWIGIWTMSTCRRVVIVNVGRFSYVLKVKKMTCTSAVIRQMQLCDVDHDLDGLTTGCATGWQLCEVDVH